MAAGPGAASGSWRQLCGHERGLTAASGSPRGRAARGRPCEQPGAPRGAVRPLLLVHSLPLQTNSFCLGGGEARPLTSWPIFLCALLSLCLISFSSHVLAVGRLSARQRCAWQVSHGASDGLSGAGTAGQQLPRVPLVSAPSALWPLRSGLRSLAAVQQQERGLGWGSCSAEPPPHVQSSSASVCCRNPTVAAEKPQPVLLVLASPFVQMVRDKWRRRSRSDQLKGNAVLSCGASPSSEASNCSSSCAGGWVRGAGSAGGVRAPCRAAAPAFVLRLPVGDLTPGLSGRF